MRTQQLVGVVSFATVLGAVGAVRADDAVPAFEVGGPTVSAKDLLEPDQLAGPGWTVRDAVRISGVLGTFEIESKFGLFVCPSRRLAVERMREITVMGRVAKKDSNDEFLKSLGNRLEQVPSGLVELVKDPEGSLDDMGKSAERTFGRVKDLFGKRKKTKYEDDSAEQMLIAGEKRKLAAELGVDPYSTNSKLQAFLTEIAKARAGGRFAVDLASMALPGAIGMVKSVTTFRDDAKSLLRDKTPAELDRINDERLAKMGVAPYVRAPFLTQVWLSPRHKTVIVAALGRLEGTADVAAFLSACLATKDEAQAFLHEEQAGMLADHHASIEPLTRLDAVGGLVLAFTTSGRVVAPLPVDRISWSEEVDDVTQAVLARPGVKEASVRQMLVTGLVTERAGASLKSLGFVVNPRFAIPTPGK